MSCSSTQAQPLQLPWSNTTLNSDGGAIARGIALQIGTPPQLFALTPTTLLNNTYVNNLASCGSNANDSCISSIGGGWESDSSSSFSQTTQASWNGSAESNADSLIGIPALYFNDVLTISDSETLPGYPVSIQTGIGFYGALPLGQNSTFINRLVEADYAPSRSWSIFTGIYSSIQAGALIIGGYADRFYTGELYSKNITDGAFCPACWDVTSMMLEIPGQEIELLDSAAMPMQAIVDPYYPTMIVPDHVMYTFGNATNATIEDITYFLSYSPDNVPDANITVTLGNGLTTKIPQRALFDPPAFDNGLLQLNRNNSVVYGTIQPWWVYVPGTVAPNAAILGLPYSAYVYMIRDFERNTLSIANANQNAQISGDAITICPVSDNGGGGGSSNTGAIAGGVVGGVVGLALIIALAWFLWRRKKRSTKAGSPPGASGESDDYTKAELSNDSAVPPAYSSAGVDTGKGPVGAAGTGVSQELPAGDAHGPGVTQELPADRTTALNQLPAEGKVVRSELPA